MPICIAVMWHTHLSCIDILNIMIYQTLTVYLYVQYVMTNAVVVYYGCQFYSSATI